MFGAPPFPPGVPAGRRLILPGATPNKIITRTTRGLVGWWPLTSNTISGATARDYSKSNVTGTLIGSPPSVGGNLGTALSLDGSTRYVDLGNPSALDITGDITISIWATMASLPLINNTFRYLLSKGYNGLRTQYEFALQNSGTTAFAAALLFGFYTGSANIGTYWIYGSNIVTNRLYHFAATKSGSVYTIYVNGEAVATNTDATACVSVSQKVEIGSFDLTGTASRLFDGKLSDARIYNRGLSFAEIRQLYNEPALDYVAPIDRIWSQISDDPAAATTVTVAIAATDSDATTASIAADNPIAASISPTDSGATTAAIAATVGAVTGTLAATDGGATTAAIAASNPISAAIAATDADGTTAAIVATNPISASIAATDSDATTAAIAATNPISAAIAATDSGATTAAIAADNPISAAIAATDSDATTAAITGVVGDVVTVDIAATDSGATTAAIAAASTITGTLAATDSDATTAAIVASNPISGTLAATDSGGTTAAIAAASTISGTLAATDSGATTAALAAGVVVSGTLAATDSGATTASLAATVGPVGAVTGTLAASITGPTVADIRGFVGAIDTSGVDQAGFVPAPIGEGPPGALSQAASMSWMRRVVDVLNNTQRGKLNCTGFVTLTPGGATTTLTDPRIGPFSQITLSPLSANAAGVPWYISAQTAGEATVTHDISAAVDRTFTYAIIG